MFKVEDSILSHPFEAFVSVTLVQFNMKCWLAHMETVDPLDFAMQQYCSPTWA